MVKWDLFLGFLLMYNFNCKHSIAENSLRTGEKWERMCCH